MNPFGSAIYIIAALFLLAMALIGYGVYSETGWITIVGAVLGVGIVAIVLSGLSGARYS